MGYYVKRRGFAALLSGGLVALSGCNTPNIDIYVIFGDDDENADDDENGAVESQNPMGGYLSINQMGIMPGVEPVEFEETPFSEVKEVEDAFNTAAVEGQAQVYYQDLDEAYEMLDEIPDEATGEAGSTYVIFRGSSYTLNARIEYL